LIKLGCETYPAEWTSCLGGGDKRGHRTGAARPAVGSALTTASEQLDGESGWRMLAPGELVHVRPDLSVHSQIAITQPPAHLVPLPADNPNIDT
jgi:glutamine amidotransferase